MTDRANRILWCLIGLVLVAAGTLGLCLSASVFGTSRAHAPIVTSTLVRHWRQGGSWSYVVAGVVAFVVATLGGLVVRGQLSRAGGTRLLDVTISAMNPPRGHGATTVRAAALSHALEADLQRTAGLQHARVGLFGDPAHTRIRAQLDVADDIHFADITTATRAAIQQLTNTSGLVIEDAQITIRLAPGPPRRVA